MSKDFIPHNDADFLQWTKNFMNYLSGLKTAISFPDSVYAELLTQQADFTQKLDLAEEAATRTKLTVQAKNTARKILEKNLRQAIREYLTNSHLVTDEDRDGLGLPIPKTTRTPSPVAATYPDFDIDSSMIRRLTVHFYDQGQKKSKAKPPGQHCAEIRWAIRETPPASLKDLINSSVDTHTPFTLEFDENERGKTVYFCLCWENTRGEKGPWSEIQSAIIP
ncbi:MAG: hypothetical protein LBJ63_01500 [Prevotellaceae bacterium]|jgi:hypothetical protein|nr:hypothetical protein [Prevotellaceae bacterium]